MTDKISDGAAGALLLHAIQAGRHITTAEIEYALAEERRAGRQWAIDTLRQMATSGPGPLFTPTQMADFLSSRDLGESS